jgi:hypothetical protein
MKLLGVKTRITMWRNYTPAVRIGSMTFYTLEELGLTPAVVPPSLPPVPVTDLATATEMGAIMGWTRQWVTLMSDFKGGPLKTVVPYGIQRLWIVGHRPRLNRCLGVNKDGTRCKSRVWTQKCWVHRENKNDRLVPVK